MASGTRVREVLLERAQNDISRYVVALANRYDLSVTELTALLVREVAAANQIALEDEARLNLESEPK